MSESAARTRSRPPYALVFGALILLTAVEIGVSYLSGGIRLGLLAILALMKATLVALFFMHLRSDSRVYAFLFLLGFFLAIPIVLVMTIVMPAF